MQTPRLIWGFLLSLSATILAAPPIIHSNDNDALSLFQPDNSYIHLPNATAALNLTTIASPTHKTTCYGPGYRSPKVDLLACFPIIQTLVNTVDYNIPRVWHTSSHMARAMKKGTCKMQLIDGAADDVFTPADMVEALEMVLEECQPDVSREYGGTGGQRTVGRYGFMVRVVGRDGG